MPTFKYDKIVRDKILDLIQASGGTAVTKDLSANGLLDALKNKLIEEAAEVNEATHRLDLTEELADVLEVIHGISKAAQISLDDIEKTRLAKKEKRGGFNDGLYIAHATFDEGHEITKYCRDRPTKYPEIK